MDIKRFYSLCLQGNVMQAIEYIKEFKEIDKAARDLYHLYENRFLKNNEELEIASDDEWVRKIVSCYYRYFRSVLTGSNIKEAEETLGECLRKLIDRNKAYDLDHIESELKNIFKEKGYYFLGGKTLPFWGPYIWENMQKYEFNVSLVDCEQSVTVFVMSKFLMLSWAHFATMGKKYAGGWAKADGLRLMGYTM